MEAHNFFADHVHVGGPVFVVLALIRRAIAEGGDVVGERIEPNVDHVLGIARHGDAPGKCAAADGEIAQASFDKGEHFVAPCFGADEIGLAGVEVDQLLLEGRELEKIVLLFHRLGGAAAFRAGCAWTD